MTKLSFGVNFVESAVLRARANVYRPALETETSKLACQRKIEFRESDCRVKAAPSPRPTEGAEVFAPPGATAFPMRGLLKVFEVILIAYGPLDNNDVPRTCDSIGSATELMNHEARCRKKPVSLTDPASSQCILNKPLDVRVKQMAYVALDVITGHDAGTLKTRGWAGVL